MKTRRKLPQGTRRCPRLHLSRGHRPWRCRRRPRSRPRRRPSRCRRARGAGAPRGARDAADTDGSVGPSRAACGRSRACGAGASRSITSARPASRRAARAAPPVALLPPVAVPVPPVEIVPPPPVDVVPPRPLAVVPPEPTVPAVAVEPPLPPPIESEPAHPTTAKSTADSQDRAVFPPAVRRASWVVVVTRFSFGPGCSFELRSMSLRATFLRSRPVAPAHGMFLATSAAYQTSAISCAPAAFG